MTFQLQLTPPSYYRPSYEHKPTDRLIALTDDVHTVAAANTKWIISKSVGKVTQSTSLAVHLSVFLVLYDCVEQGLF